MATALVVLAMLSLIPDASRRLPHPRRAQPLNRRGLLSTALAAPAAALLLLRPARPALASDQTKLGPIYIRLASAREIQNVFAVIAAEPGGESWKLMRLMLETEEYERASQMAHLYDTYLRKDVLQPLVQRLAPASRPEAQRLADEVLQTFKGIDKAARKRDKARALALTDALAELINRYAALAPAAPNLRPDEAAKLGLPAGGTPP
jgi:hypothetical protein